MKEERSRTREKNACTRDLTHGGQWAANQRACISGIGADYLSQSGNPTTTEYEIEMGLETEAGIGTEGGRETWRVAGRGRGMLVVCPEYECVE